ncbi:discoidin domain-containing protein [Cohnella silvisoli]|uniref:Discoidin domain-containing protein n=1 Tax=Cohnella silvisoli TaxID=2873699 RepID=A0ABV1KRW6_9BACL|nr:discoidin domain-containing protein [Cohnella silvisoli]MCD9022420.1 discoidin domain-containing protein [Cohnella silvisoli]
MRRVRLVQAVKPCLLLIGMVFAVFVFQAKETYAIANVEKIIPTPQQVTYTENFLTLYDGTSFSAAIVKGHDAPQAELEGVYLLQSVIARQTGANIPVINDNGNYSAYSVILSVGTSGSNALNANLINANSIVIPSHSEGYAIEKVTSGTQNIFVVTGKEAIGSYYGSTSLAQMVKKNGSNTQLRVLSVRDYPDMQVRAVKDIFTAEGMFSYADTAEWMSFLAKTKMNVFSLCYTHLSATGWRNPPADYIRAVKNLGNYERDRGTIKFMQEINPGITGGLPANTAELNQLVRTYKYGLDEGGSQIMLAFDDQGSTTPASHRDMANLLYDSFQGQEGFYLVTVPQPYHLEYTNLASYMSQYSNGLRPAIGAIWTGDTLWSHYTTPAHANTWRSYTANPQKYPFYWHNDPVLMGTLLHTGWQPSQYYFADGKVPFKGVNLNGGYIWNNMQTYTSDGAIENIFRQSTAHKIYAISLADWMWNPDAYQNTADGFNRAKRYWDTIVADPGFMKMATASSQFSAAYGPGLAVDGLNSDEQTDNVWATASGQPTTNAWWKLDLGGAQDMHGVTIRFREYNGKAYMVPATITFQVSNDNANWTTVVRKASDVPLENTSYDSTPYFYHFNANARYLRLLFEDGGQNSLIELSEVKVADEKDAVPATQNNVALGAAAAASSTLSASYPADKAVDGIVSTSTLDNAWASTTTVANAWWSAGLGGVTEIHGIDVHFRQSGSVAYRVPKSITFQTSNDNTNWTTVLKKDTNVPLEGSAYNSAQSYHYDVRGKGKYVRLLFEDGSQNTHIELSEVRVNTDNLALRKTATASSTYIGYDAGLANDGLSSDTTTNNAWATAAGPTVNSWWKVDLGSSQSFKTVNVKFREYPQGASYMIPKTITIQSSDDDVNWTTLTSRSVRVPATNGAYASVNYSYPVKGNGRYVRLLFEDGGQDSLIELSEVEITNTVVPEYQSRTANIAYGKTAVASSAFGTNYAAGKAVDGKTSGQEAENTWATAAGSQLNSWWQVDLGKTEYISRASVVFREYPYNQAYMVPKNITFQVSSDGVSWTTVTSKSGNVPTIGSAYASQPFSYILNASGRFVRLLFEEGSQDSIIELSEVEIYN